MSCTFGADGWPDWTGDTAIVVGTGPSAFGQPLDAARGLARAIVIKSSWRLAPWADALYGADRGWWLANKGLPEFGGLRITASPSIVKLFPGMRLIKVLPRPQLQTQTIGAVGSGCRRGHSGFQAINLAVQFGATRIVLVGFDMTLKHGTRWLVGDPGVGKPDAARVEEWRAGLDACALQFAALGVEVINASMRSALTAYPKIEFAQVFDAGHYQDRAAGS